MPSIDWLIIFSYVEKRGKYCLNCANTSRSSLIATKSWRWLVCEYGMPFWIEDALYNIAYVCKTISLTLWLLMDVDVIKVIIACMFATPLMFMPLQRIWYFRRMHWTDDMALTALFSASLLHFLCFKSWGKSLVFHWHDPNVDFKLWSHSILMPQLKCYS